ncbi:MAG: hypothetical protein IPM56_05255 [Ignavibacteriales bacterium]|nr:MAG: hypothetical protein IPM56_05255 [Ignavibacteriales bacterium]
MNELIILVQEGTLSEKLESLQAIRECGLTESFQFLNERIEIEDDLFVQTMILTTLYFMECPNIEAVAVNFLDVIDNSNYSILEETDRAKLIASAILLERNNCSYTQNIFDYLTQYDIRNGWIFSSLKAMLEVSQFEQVSRNELISILQSSPYYHSRVNALMIMTEKYGDQQTLNVYKSSMINDDSMGVRLYSLKALCKYEYGTLDIELRSLIETDPSWYLRRVFVDTLLSKYGQPIDLYAVQNHILVEENETALWWMQNSINNFIPHNPNLTIPQMMDSLNSYTDQLYQFGWIKNEVDYKHYREKTKNLRELFEQKKTDELCSNLNWIISQAESHHRSDVLTEEGYKFLFYYTGYIKEKIETEFGDCK